MLVLLFLQFFIGVAAYMWPTLSLARRKALGPIHRFLGMAIFVSGLATMAVGVQEKTTFVQASTNPPLFSSVMRLPGAILVFLLLTGAVVLFHHATPASGWRPAGGMHAVPSSEHLPVHAIE